MSHKIELVDRRRAFPEYPEESSLKHRRCVNAHGTPCYHVTFFYLWGITVWTATLVVPKNIFTHLQLFLTLFLHLFGFHRSAVADMSSAKSGQVENEKRVRREIANCNERRRMQSINAGFDNLRVLLPPAQDGEKLSKVSSKFFLIFFRLPSYNKLPSS